MGTPGARQSHSGKQESLLREVHLTRSWPQASRQARGGDARARRGFGALPRAQRGGPKWAGLGTVPSHTGGWRISLGRHAGKHARWAPRFPRLIGKWPCDPGPRVPWAQGSGRARARQTPGLCTPRVGIGEQGAEPAAGGGVLAAQAGSPVYSERSAWCDSSNSERPACGVTMLSRAACR